MLPVELPKKGSKVRVCNLDPRDSCNWIDATFIEYDDTVPVYPYQCETHLGVGNFQLCENKNEQPKAKPPIGLMPKRIHDSRRIKEIVSAIDRYVSADMPIPKEWIKELNNLIKED